MICEGKNIQDIADRIGFHRTTIDHELKRVPENLIYNADNAQLDAEPKHHSCGAKSKWTSEVAYQIECYLEDSWFPEQIAHARGTVSFKTIYLWLCNDFINVSKQCMRQQRQKIRETSGNSW